MVTVVVADSKVEDAKGTEDEEHLPTCSICICDYEENEVSGAME
jgi:hypothetical protein